MCMCVCSLTSTSHCNAILLSYFYEVVIIQLKANKKTRNGPSHTTIRHPTRERHCGLFMGQYLNALIVGSDSAKTLLYKLCLEWPFKGTIV